MRIDRCLHFGAFIIVFAVISGCQLLQNLEKERKIELARQDDAACVDRGYAFPGIAYQECRMDLHDKRLREQWMELQMSMRRGIYPEQGAVPQQQNSEPYRPMRIQDYRCEMRRDEESQPWIDCFETGDSRRD